MDEIGSPWQPCVAGCADLTQASPAEGWGKRAEGRKARKRKSTLEGRRRGGGDGKDAEQRVPILLFLPFYNDDAGNDAQEAGTCCSVMIQPLSASSFAQQDAVVTVSAAAVAAAATLLTGFPLASPA